MLRSALTAGLMILVLAAPAAADGPAEFGHPAGAGPGSRPVHARIHRHPVRAHARVYPLAGLRGSPVRPVSYGERDGPVFHAWLPRNTNLPIYNIPPPYFPEY